MQVRDIAGILGIDPKEAIKEIESCREELTGQGFKVAKKLSAASKLEDDAVRIIVAARDSRTAAERDAQEKAAEQARLAEEQKKREEAERQRQEEAEARKRVMEEARKRADAELERKRAELARATGFSSKPATPPPSPPTPVPPPIPQAVPPQAKAPVAGAVPPPPPPQRPAATQQQQAPAQPAASQPGPPAPPAQQRQQTHGDAPQGRRSSGEQSPPRQRDQRERPQDDRRGGPPSQRQRQDDRPPRSGDRSGGDRSGGPSGRGPVGSASADAIKRFTDAGMGPVVTDDYKQRRRTDDPRRSSERPAPARDDEAARKRRAPGAGGRERKHFRPTQIMGGEVVNRRPAARTDRPKKKSGRSQQGGRRGRSEPQRPTIVTLSGDFTVGQFAEKLAVTPADIIMALMKIGEMKTVNQVLDPDTAELIAAEMGVEVHIQREGDEYDVEKYLSMEDDPADLKLRPPVVTVMGHVDHGKTTLLDTIRKANVVSQESGGITQHIGAYFVHTAKGDIVFLDTPGHEAFTAMRARGADVTDLVILVVAANDGVKPQTVEAISHAKAAEVPIVVAINKIDVEGANLTRVKNELMSYGLVSEDLGGDILMVPVSAKIGTGVDELLENVALQAEVLELKSNPNRPAIGTVVESHIDPLRGAVATVLVQYGTLKQGDIFVCGTESGRVRAMRNDHNELVESAGPSMPVEILGLSGSPGAGEQFLVMPTENAARDIAERRQSRRKMRSAAATPHVTLENLKDQMTEGEVKILNLILKGDVQGSVEAIVASLMKIKSDKIQLRILHQGVGGVGEADVQLADASDAIILGFNVRPDASSRQLAEKLGVEIRTYSIIYQLLEEIEAAMLGMLEPVFEEVHMSRIEVRTPFKIGKLGTIAGSYVVEGTVAKNHKARLVRNGTVVWQGEIASLRRHKDDVKEVQSGLECGIGLMNFNDVKAGDEIETYVLKEQAASLVTQPVAEKAGAGADS